MTSYAERFSKLTDKEIMNIASHLDEYAHEAQEAAMVEFEKRKLSLGDLEVQKQKADFEKVRKQNDWLERAKQKYFFSASLTFSEKIFNGICLLLFSYFLYLKAYSFYLFVLWFFKDGLENLDIDLAFFVGSVLVATFLPIVAIAFFWSRYWLGWFLFVIYAMWCLSEEASFIIYKYFSSERIPFDSYDSPLMDAELYVTPLIIIGLIVYACKQEIRTWFEVSKKAATYTIVSMSVLLPILAYVAYKTVTEY